MKYKIILVPFPTDDLSSFKVRPALCLTDKISSLNHVLICMISSKLSKAKDPHDIILNKENEWFSETGLNFSSVIKLHRMTTISTQVIARELGFLPKPYQKLINNQLKILFEF